MSSIQLRLSARGLAAFALLALAACNGTAYVSLTSTPAAVTKFLAYRVGIVSIKLEDSTGAGAQQLLPAATTVDLTTLADVDEVLGATTVKQGKYSMAVVTLDYGSADIVADDGSAAGVALSPLDAAGNPLGQVQVSLQLDPADTFDIGNKSSVFLALDFRLAASNAVNLTTRTVTVTPLLLASSSAVDSKPVRLRGKVVAAADAGTGQFTVGVTPFDGPTAGAGQITVMPGAGTTFEVDGVPSTGSTGFSALAADQAGVWAVADGTWSTTTSTTTTAATAAGSSGTSSLTTTVSLAATQVYSGTSAQSNGVDQVSGIVTARSGDVLQVGSATWRSAAGAAAYQADGAVVTVGVGTTVLLPGQGTSAGGAVDQLSVGAGITAFGTATATGTNSVSLDATSGRVRLSNATAAGLVSAQGTGSLTLALNTLGGRSVTPFVFAGTGSSAALPSLPGAYQVSTGALDLLNATAGTPVTVTGLVGSFGAAPPDFVAISLADETTLQSELVLDWGTAGTAAPFTTVNTSELVLNIHNTGIGARHRLDGGAQSIDVTSLTADLTIVPDTTVATAIYAIAHSATASVENFNTFAAFAAALQTELAGSTLATTVTAEGLYTASTENLAVRSLTLTVNN